MTNRFFSEREPPGVDLCAGRDVFPLHGNRQDLNAWQPPPRRVTCKWRKCFISPRAPRSLFMTIFHVFSWTRILQGFNQLPRTSQPAPKRRFLLKHFSTFSNWMLVHYNAWYSTSRALFPRRRWPPAAWCLWSPALVRLTKTRRTTSPQKAFESLAFKPPPQTFLVENLVRFLSLCFLSVVISVNHLKTNLFQSLQFTYSHRKSFSNFLMWLWIFKWRKRSFVFAPNFPNL